jgi:K(+)-stimulated pyrophosphate-energized sodium pump
VASGVAGPFKPVIDALSIVQPEIILGLIMGGSVIYWFTGASCQAVVTGAYSAVVYIKEHMNLSATTASQKDSKEVVRICTVYAQKGMWNIFIVVFCFALALPFFNAYFFIGYLIGIAFSASFRPSSWPMPAARGTTPRKSSRWISARRAPNSMPPPSWATPWAIPFKDTSSVAMNPVIKFTTLFRPAGHGDRRDHERARHQDGHWRVLLYHRADLRLPVVLLHAHPGRIGRHAALRRPVGK